MSRYLLDSNVFIQAKNLYYGFDIAPGFWHWLELANKSGIVASVSNVLDELRGIEDELATWASRRGSEFFIPPDVQVMPALAQVSNWASGQEFEPAAVTTFLQVADYWLVSHALAHGFIVVTHEIPADSTRRIKIPNACLGVGVECMSPFDMLRRESAKFVLAGVQSP